MACAMGYSGTPASTCQLAKVRRRSFGLPVPCAGQATGRPRGHPRNHPWYLEPGKPGTGRLARHGPEPFGVLVARRSQGSLPPCPSPPSQPTWSASSSTATVTRPARQLDFAVHSRRHLGAFGERTGLRNIEFCKGRIQPGVRARTERPGAARQRGSRDLRACIDHPGGRAEQTRRGLLRCRLVHRVGMLVHRIDPLRQPCCHPRSGIHRNLRGHPARRCSGVRRLPHSVPRTPTPGSWPVIRNASGLSRAPASSGPSRQGRRASRVPGPRARRGRRRPLPGARRGAPMDSGGRPRWPARSTR